MEVECLFPSLIFKEVNFLLNLLGNAPAHFNLPSSELNNEVISVYDDENFFIIKWGKGEAYLYGVDGVIFIEKNIFMRIGVIRRCLSEY